MLCSGCSMLGLRQTLLEDDGLDLRVRASHRANLAKIGQMAGTQREAQGEKLGLCVAGFLLQLIDREIAQSVELTFFHDASSRETILVPIGSFAAARSSASRATAGATPE